VPRQQFATFSVADHLFGIEVTDVQEVIRHQQMTPVPLAPPEISGLINLRGQIVTAIDLRRRLGLAPRPDCSLPMNVVVRDDDASVSLLVDEIGDVLELADDDFERPPDTLDEAARALISGAYKLQRRLLLVLDTQRLLRLDTASTR
jgi:purine-binding chemotaxis protein CheW